MGFCNQQQKIIYVMDSRPKANAVANMLRGGGYELSKFYKNLQLEFNNIENIHVMRNSIFGVHKFALELPLETEEINERNQPEELQETHWFEHLRLVLISVARVIELTHNEANSVVVHCSDGWDRTSQTVALAELLSDPYYRTIEGFLRLIDKEWIQFGHQFALRYGHAAGTMDNYKESQRSPIFPQWLDILHQLLHIFPTAFEFNELLLLTLMEELYSCRYGNFLFDSHKQRLENQIFNLTKSLWTFIIAYKDFYKNPNYHHDPSILILDINNMNLKLWNNYFIKFHRLGPPHPFLVNNSSNKAQPDIQVEKRKRKRTSKSSKSRRKRISGTLDVASLRAKKSTTMEPESSSSSSKSSETNQLSLSMTPASDLSRKRTSSFSVLPSPRRKRKRTSKLRNHPTSVTINNDDNNNNTTTTNSNEKSSLSDISRRSTDEGLKKIPLPPPSMLSTNSTPNSPPTILKKRHPASQFSSSSENSPFSSPLNKMQTSDNHSPLQSPKNIATTTAARATSPVTLKKPHPPPPKIRTDQSYIERTQNNNTTTTSMNQNNNNTFLYSSVIPSYSKKEEQEENDEENITSLPNSNSCDDISKYKELPVVNNNKSKDPTISNLIEIIEADSDDNDNDNDGDDGNDDDPPPPPVPVVDVEILNQQFKNFKKKLENNHENGYENENTHENENENENTPENENYT